MAVMFHGYLFANVPWVERSLFLIGGFALVYPSYVSTIAGTVILSILIFRQMIAARTGKPVAMNQEGEV
jgi:TRAP-type uncharacterized transport system fused permease subunit